MQNAAWGQNTGSPIAEQHECRIYQNILRHKFAETKRSEKLCIWSTSKELLCYDNERLCVTSLCIMLKNRQRYFKTLTEFIPRQQVFVITRYRARYDKFLSAWYFAIYFTSFHGCKNNITLPTLGYNVYVLDFGLANIIFSVPPSPQKLHPLFFGKAPLNLRTVQAPPPPSSILVFRDSHPWISDFLVNAHNIEIFHPLFIFIILR